MGTRPSRPAAAVSEPAVPTPRAAAESVPEDEPDGHSTRRERQRRDTIEKIKDSARVLLAPHQGGELSLRAVARDVGITPSGIYRYFASRQELVAAIARDAYASAGAALETAAADAGTRTHLEQAVALAHGYRRWCLEHRAEFSLIFATAAEETTDAVSAWHVHSFLGPPLAQYVAGIRSEAVDVSAATLAPESALAPAVESLRQGDPNGLSVREVGVLLSGWAALHGFVALELLGPLASLYDDVDFSYDQHARAVLASMGYRDSAAVARDAQ